jgi:hypothetical protein
LIEQLRDIKLLPQTYSSEVDYSLFIMEAMGMLLDILEMRAGGAPTVFAPPIIAGTTSVFSVSLFPLLRNHV